MLKSRIISAVIGAVLLLGVVLSGTVPLRIAVAIVSALMVFELCRAVKVNGILTAFSVIFGAVLASEFLPGSFKDMAVCLFLLCVLTTLLLQHKKQMSVSDAALCCLFAFFIGSFMGCVTKIRMLEGGAYWIWLIFIGAWGSDVFAYFSGKLFGKKKLIPDVSPKKTVAGAIGGALAAATGFAVYGFFMGDMLGNVNFISLFVAGLAVSATGQIGDLVASCIKRQYGIKDYGKIMPGHGGAMDRFDSILFVAPIILFYIQLIR